MGARISPAWKNKMIDLIESNSFISETITWNTAAKWLVYTISERGKTPKVENLGVGVKRISINGTCCPTCGKAVK